MEVSFSEFFEKPCSQSEQGFFRCKESKRRPYQNLRNNLSRIYPGLLGLVIMQLEYYKRLKQETKILYSSIGSISCPVLNNEKIFFTKAGFNHLIRKGRIPRPIQDQIRRFHLLREVIDILKDENVEIFVCQGDTAVFWELSKLQDNRIIKVVIRKLNNTEKHFFSVMDRMSY